MLQKVLNTLRPAVIALIASAGLTIIVSAFWGEGQAVSLNGIDGSMAVIFAICLFLMLKRRQIPLWSWCWPEFCGLFRDFFLSLKRLFFKYGDKFKIVIEIRCVKMHLIFGFSGIREEKSLPWIKKLAERGLKASKV